MRAATTPGVCCLTIVLSRCWRNTPNRSPRGRWVAENHYALWAWYGLWIMIKVKCKHLCCAQLCNLELVLANVGAIFASSNFLYLHLSTLILRHASTLYALVWEIYCAILVLGGGGGGVIVAHIDHESLRQLQNCSRFWCVGLLCTWHSPAYVPHVCICFLLARFLCAFCPSYSINLSVCLCVCPSVCSVMHHLILARQSNASILHCNQTWLLSWVEQ